MLTGFCRYRVKDRACSSKAIQFNSSLKHPALVFYFSGSHWGALLKLKEGKEKQALIYWMIRGAKWLSTQTAMKKWQWKCSKQEFSRLWAVAMIWRQGCWIWGGRNGLLKHNTLTAFSCLILLYLHMLEQLKCIHMIIFKTSKSNGWHWESDSLISLILYIIPGHAAPWLIKVRVQVQ